MACGYHTSPIEMTMLRRFRSWPFVRRSGSATHRDTSTRSLRLGGSLLGLAVCLGCPGFGERELESVVSGGDKALCEDVQAVLEVRCNSCHSSPPTGGAPRYLRLDSFADVGDVLGAVSQAERSLIRAEGGTMPPAAFGRMTEDEIAVLRRWVDAGTPTAECEPTQQALEAHSFAHPDVLDSADIGRDAAP